MAKTRVVSSTENTQRQPRPSENVTVATETTTINDDPSSTASAPQKKKKHEAVRNKSNTRNQDRLQPFSSSPSPTLTMWHVGYALTVYFCLPLLVLMATSAYYDDQLAAYASSNNNNNTTIASTQLSPPSTLWILGFRSSKKLWQTIYDRILSVTCWGLTFVFVRKGCNPQTRRNFLSRFGKGAILSTLSVFYSTFGRILLIQHVFHEPRTALLDAVLVGVSWALANMAIRRRLDPRSRPKLWHWKTQRDVGLGALAFAVGSYGRAVSSPYVLPLGQRFLRAQLPVLLPLPSAVTHFLDVVCDVSPEKLGSVTLQACWVGIWYGIPYLCIRRACNPDSYTKKGVRAFFQTHGSDALFGSLALVVGVYLKRTMSKWLPVVWFAMLRWLSWHLPFTATTTTWGDANLDGEMDDEL
eukprot:scaffold5860_cov223-Amphora_coffeaeformis.AAC.4